MKDNIPLLDLKREYKKLSKEIEEEVLKAFSDAQYILGTQVKKLEQEINSYLSVDQSIGVASGTDALLISLRALAINRKEEEYFSNLDEIITTPFTFTATGGTILRSGATPVFVDIDSHTFNLDPDQVKKAINPNTIGIMPVHLYGQTCQMDEIMAIAEDNDIFVVEDVAQAFGAKWRDKMAGSIGDIAGFSFFPSKNLGCFGDGGLVATNNEGLADLAKMLRTHGGKDKYNCSTVNSS